MSRAGWPIVVGGCHRSGTSVVRRVLDAHSRIHCGPEVPFLRDFYGDYRDDPLAHLRFATAARAILPEDELLDVLGTAFVRVHERAAERAGKARWADKAPENVVYADAWQRVLGDSWLLVHVVRDPLDTVASMREARFPLTLPAELDGLVALYRRFGEAGLAFGERHPERYRVVVYERLASSPEAEVRALTAWLGERFEPAQLALDAPHHQPGLEDPKVALTSVIHADSVSRWPQLLAADEAAYVEAEARALYERICALAAPPGRWEGVKIPREG